MTLTGDASAGFLCHNKAVSRAKGERMNNTRSFEHETNAAVVQKDKLEHPLAADPVDVYPRRRHELKGVRVVHYAEAQVFEHDLRALAELVL